MPSRIQDWWRERRRRRAEAARRRAAAQRAVALARTAFSTAYPDRQVLDDWRHVDAVEDGHIVTLLTPGTRPPARSWWRVGDSGAVVEISLEQAARQIRLPVWR